jgi:hypothetical protein
MTTDFVDTRDGPFIPHRKCEPLTDHERDEAEWWCYKYKETLDYLATRMDEYIKRTELRGSGLGWSDKTKLDSADTSLQLLFTTLRNSTNWRKGDGLPDCPTGGPTLEDRQRRFGSAVVPVPDVVRDLLEDWDDGD